MKRNDVTLITATVIAVTILALGKDIATNGTTAPFWKILPAIATLVVAGLSARLYLLAAEFQKDRKN